MSGLAGLSHHCWLRSGRSSAASGTPMVPPGTLNSLGTHPPGPGTVITFRTSRALASHGRNAHSGHQAVARGCPAHHGLPLDAGELRRVADGVEPGDPAVVDAYREQRVDLAVEPQQQ